MAMTRAAYRRVRAAVVLALALALGTGPAGALTPLPECSFDTRTGKLVDWDTGRGDEVWFFIVGAGFLSWEIWDRRKDRPTMLVLQHCPTGREWTAVLPAAGFDAIRNRWMALTEGKGAFTPTQLGQEMQRLGARMRRTRGTYGTCTCDNIAEWN